MSVTLAFSPERELDDLRAYLADDYDEKRLHAYEEQLEAEVERVGDEGVLYRTSHAYLYNLTAFAMTGTKLPYLRRLTEEVPPGSRILDYGCGIGSDGLLLLEAGYEVEFADFANPSAEYLRWRLQQRGLNAPVHDLDVNVPGGFDAAFAYDVIEHVPAPYELLAQMERRARLVQVNLLEFEPHEQTLHYRLPIGRLLFRAARRELERYEIHYGTSHLIAYRPERASLARQGRNLAVVLRRLTGRTVSRARARMR